MLSVNGEWLILKSNLLTTNFSLIGSKINIKLCFHQKLSIRGVHQELDNAVKMRKNPYKDKLLSIDVFRRIFFEVSIFSNLNLSQILIKTSLKSEKVCLDAFENVNIFLLIYQLFLFIFFPGEMYILFLNKTIFTIIH